MNNDELTGIIAMYERVIYQAVADRNIQEFSDEADSFLKSEECQYMYRMVLYYKYGKTDE